MLKEILKILEDDARTTPEQISVMTGLPADEIIKTIEEAEKDRTILRYKTLVNWEKAGSDHVWALIEVKVTPQKDVGFDAIAERIYKFPRHGVYTLFPVVMTCLFLW